MQKKTIKVQSVAFAHNGHIPPKYTCEGDDINFPLEINDVPEEVKSLALIMEDPDAPNGTFYHWLLWNISPNEAIAEGNVPGISGTNSFGKTGYGGPCLPSGSHRYFIKVFGLDKTLDLPESSSRNELLEAMKGHVVAGGELMGRYQRRKTMATH